MARSFNGTSDRIHADAAVTSPIWWNDVFGRCYAGWVKLPAGQSNAYFFAEGNPGSNTIWWGLSITSASPATNLLRWNGGSSTPAVVGGVVADSTWHHVALVIDNSNNAPLTGNNYFLYLDGVLQGSARMTSTVTGGGTRTSLAFGCLPRITDGNFCQGLLAHWAIWNRPLSAEEVRILARGIKLPSEFEPQNYWPLTAPDANIAQSIGKRRNHGTLVGTTFSADVPPLVGRPQPALWHQRYARWRVPQLAVPFITSITATHAPTLVGNVNVPFIASATSVFAPTLSSDVDVPFVSSVTSVYTPTVTAASSDVNVPFINSATSVFAPAFAYEATSGAILFTADPATVYPATATEATLTLVGDAPSLTGAIQVSSGAVIIAGDSPTIPGAVAPASGTITLRADAPHVIAGFTTVSGVLRLAADAPTVYPVAAPSGTASLKSDAAMTAPTAAVSGRFLLRADGPAVYPITVDSISPILFKTDTPTVGGAAVVLEVSGIIRLRSDTPTVTPLTEPPPPPPPPPPGTGLSVSVTV